MTGPRLCVTDLSNTQVEALIANLGEPSYRAGQLQRWLYRGLAKSFDEMADLPKHLRQKLTRNTQLHSLTPLHEVVGSDGTVKTLFALADGKNIESTPMPYTSARNRRRHTLCLSTQVGCAVGCPFCATGQQGFERNLTPGEMIDQVLYFARRLREQSNGTVDFAHYASRITNFVFMGMGEPLANYDALWQAMVMLNSPQGFGLGARNMVISTAGLVPQIKRLSQEKLQVGLAISLHASDNALRDRLVPINKRYPLEDLVPACREYFELTGRRPSFEYVLFEGINDSVGQARSLAQLLRGLNCHVNLIPANRTADQKFRPPTMNAVLSFQRELKRLRIACTLRQGRGLDIVAGCGQLRSRTARPSRCSLPVRIPDDDQIPASRQAFLAYAPEEQS